MGTIRKIFSTFLKRGLLGGDISRIIYIYVLPWSSKTESVYSDLDLKKYESDMLFFTPFRIQNAQRGKDALPKGGIRRLRPRSGRLPPFSLITAHEVGVLNEKRCKRINNFETFFAINYAVGNKNNDTLANATSQLDTDSFTDLKAFMGEKVTTFFPDINKVVPENIIKYGPRLGRNSNVIVPYSSEKEGGGKSEGGGKRRIKTPEARNKPLQ